MARIFEHFHLSLVEDLQHDLLTAPVSREEWLKRMFGHDFHFVHRGKQFYWVPREDTDDLIAGTVAKKRVRTQHRSPEEGADEFEAEEWQGSIVVVDPRHRPDGQKLAFERDDAVGQPSAVLESMISHINTVHHQYTIHIKSLFDADTFRTFASRHGNRVKYVTFNFVVPNMFFGASTSVDEGLRRLGKDTKAQSVRVRLESEQGVDTESENVKDALDYAESGNASVTAQAMTGEKYSSTSRRLSVKMHSILNLAQKTQVYSWLRSALGHDQAQPESNDSVDSANRINDDPAVG